MSELEVFKLVGTVAGGRQREAAQMRIGSEVALLPEPDNKFDPNAVAVILQDVGQVGYVPAVIAELLAPLMTSEGLPGEIVDIRIQPDTGDPIGADIAFVIP